MFKEKYIFNPETLRYERNNPPLKKKMVDFSLYLSLIIIIAILFRIGFDNILQSPKIGHFSVQNEKLKLEYKELNGKIAKAELLLQEVQKRDDKVYRSVFDLEPLPSSLRDAGYGGSAIPYGGLASSGRNEMVNKTAFNLEKLSTKAKVQSGYLFDLYIKAQSQQKLIASKPSIQPISPADSFRITSTFGFRWDPFTNQRRMHQGLDLAGEIGLKIYATGDGIVVSAEDGKNGYGKEVVIDHGFGYISRYAHLQRIDVVRGQSIKRGEYLGRLGSTGRSTGPHLHYEIIYENKTVNPRLFYFENLNPLEFSTITAQSSN
jgi:murein DD-endopeptidase MepM/ murein hydrolase activator NlpD